MPQTIKLVINTDTGNALSARLELPDSKPHLYATFAHCFTCSKDSLAAFRISKALARLGIATLRFDFTGLGDSEGDFTQTNFSTTCQDLTTVIAYLAQNYQAPRLLIGHSLGGTASLASAVDIASIDLIATIASPSQPSHVLHHFGDAITELNSGNNAVVNIGGVGYEFQPGFIDDLMQYDMQTTLGRLDKPVLIFEVEGDDIVGAHNARELLGWSSHRSRRIELKHSDHLISDRNTAQLIAEKIVEFTQQELK